MSQPKSALIIGATGKCACGRHALKSALESPNISKLTSIGRREVAYSGPGSEKLVQKIVDFDNLAQSREAFAGHDVAFLALGTTRADAGSAEAFYKIDHDYVIEAAKLFKETNAENPNAHVMYVSSTGSDVSSSLLYPRTKGEVERDLIALGLPR
ncbi:hypothetical protein M427DRAFT_102305 [Gonapodya prolifera JEL478]|uniref:NAD(P)-binding domain-containing protein n=1 Tax=Gonapodya prolifera (strain JEL478) TaxID=1344416 RepID=A0A139A410_GONPJ|nr:hypothetical protein M427DRAFT_102305 [Gonapodya prolifera JEL478]|eukprot:KXS11531.1 hypothetical protein M427DRAFT_102305 [Gonapodya prolifera JEL478]